MSFVIVMGDNDIDYVSAYGPPFETEADAEAAITVGETLHPGYATAVEETGENAVRVVELKSVAELHTTMGEMA